MRVVSLPSALILWGMLLVMTIHLHGALLLVAVAVNNVATSIDVAAHTCTVEP